MTPSTWTIANGDGSKDKVNGCFLTLLTKPCYLQGLLVLQQSLLATDSKYPLIVMATPALLQDSRDIITNAGIRIIDVDSLRPTAGTHTLDDHDRRFEDTWTKLRAFELVEFDRIVLMDCDMLIFNSIDSLFTFPLPGDDWIAAVHACTCNPRKLAHYPKDWTPQNCAYTPLTHPTALTSPTQITSTSPRTYGLLNSGLVILTPSKALMQTIVEFIATSPLIPTYKFPDQDLLAEVFKGKWKPLPWVFNALKTLREIHKPLWRDEETRNIHYILDKPWDYRPSNIQEKEEGLIKGEPKSNASGEPTTATTWPVTGDTYQEVHQWWWTAYDVVLSDLKKIKGSGYALVDAWVAH